MVEVLQDPLDVTDGEVHPCVQVVSDLPGARTLDDPAFQMDAQHQDVSQMELMERPYVSLVVVAYQVMNLLNFDYVLGDRFSVGLVRATVCSYSLMKVGEESYDWTMELALTYWLEAEILT